MDRRYPAAALGDAALRIRVAALTGVRRQGEPRISAEDHRSDRSRQGVPRCGAHLPVHRRAERGPRPGGGRNPWPRCTDDVSRRLGRVATRSTALCPPWTKSSGTAAARRRSRALCRGKPGSGCALARRTSVLRNWDRGEPAPLRHPPCYLAAFEAGSPKTTHGCWSPAALAARAPSTWSGSCFGTEVSWSLSRADVEPATESPALVGTHPTLQP